MRTYSLSDPEADQVYLITVFSENEDDWKIDVYENDQITIAYTYFPHEFLSIPERLRTPILMDIGRAQSNIKADNEIKKANG